MTLEEYIEILEIRRDEFWDKASENYKEPSEFKYWALYDELQKVIEELGTVSTV